MDGDVPCDLIVRGRLALSGEPVAAGSLAVRDGRIVAVGERDLRLPAHEELDVGDDLVLPGWVDVHVHTRSADPDGLTPTTRAAAVGGVTTIVDMPFDSGGPVGDPDEYRAKMAAVESQAVVDVALYATVLPGAGTGHVRELAALGASAFKVSTFETNPDRFPRLPDGELMDTFAAIEDVDGLVAVHSENDEIVKHLIGKLKASGAEAPEAHGLSRPPLVETEAIARGLELARATGVRLHLCHVTVDRGVELATAARRDGVDVTVETCPHYLLLDESRMDAVGPVAKVNPPLRSAAEPAALWARVADGGVQILSSDHVSWDEDQKRRDDVFAAAAGFPFLDIGLPLVLGDSRAADVGLARFVELVSEAPARRFGLWPRKGSLRVGADADIVILAPDEAGELDPGATHAGWSPYAGLPTAGRIRRTLVRGTSVAIDGQSCGEPGWGSYVASSRAAALGSGVTAIVG